MYHLSYCSKPISLGHLLVVGELISNHSVLPSILMQFIQTLSYQPRFRLYSLGMWICSRHHLVSHLSGMLLIIFFCTIKVCFLQNSGHSIWVKRKLRQFMIILIINFVRVGSMSYPVSLGIPSSLYEKRMVNCIWQLIIKLSMHRLCLTGILFLAIMIFWIPSMEVPAFLRLIYSPGIIRFCFQRRITIK